MICKSKGIMYDLQKDNFYLTSNYILSYKKSYKKYHIHKSVNNFKYGEYEEKKVRNHLKKRIIKKKTFIKASINRRMKK